MATARLFRPGMLRECWEFRGFIFASVRRDFVSRYLGTQLGFLWAVAQPLALILIYTVVFAEIMKPMLPNHSSRFAYGIYLCAGIMVWQLFSELLNRSVGVFVHNALLLKKVSLPRLSLPIIAALSALSNFVVVLVLFAGFTLVIGQFPAMTIWALIPVTMLVVALASGLGVLLGTINVFYRDVEQSVAMVLQFWFWLTPIVYPIRSLPPLYAELLGWNPMWPIVSFAQSIFLGDRLPPWSTLLYPFGVALACLFLGLLAFRKLSGDVVDEL